MLAEAFKIKRLSIYQKLISDYLYTADSKRLSGYFSILTAIFLFCSAAGILLISVLSHTVSRPVRLIRSMLSAIASGDFSKDASIEWDNEFGTRCRDRPVPQYKCRMLRIS